MNRIFGPFASLLLLIFLLPGIAPAQTHTVGTTLMTPDVADGYVLLAPLSTTQTFLLDNCGRLVHEWNNSDRFPGLAVYLLEDGSLLRTCRMSNNTFDMGGIGGRVERWSWDDSLMWAYNFTNDSLTQHHDVEFMPNGNVMILAAEKKTRAEMIAVGRDSNLIVQGMVWPEFLMEVKPIGPDSMEVVWEWHAIDHVVQDFDSSLATFGVIRNHPELMDVNYIYNVNHPDWMHANSVDYNPYLDQLILSIGKMSEVWIIDHGTTTQEAAAHIGGARGKGGDLLYRWGNPEIYQRGDSSDKQIFFQHHAHWIQPDRPDSGKVMIFNNGRNRNWSSVDIIDIPQSAPGDYYLEPDSTFGPALPVWTWYTPAQFDFYAKNMSGAEQQPNGNVIMCEASGGWVMEVDSAGNLVWEFVSPVVGESLYASQGTTPGSGSNNFFRMDRYAPDYPGLDGRVLVPGDPLEANFDIVDCLSILTETEAAVPGSELRLYPNPSRGILFVGGLEDHSVKGEIIDMMGRVLLSADMRGPEYRFDLSGLTNGWYLLRMEDGSAKRFHLER